MNILMRFFLFFFLFSSLYAEQSLKTPYHYAAINGQVESIRGFATNPRLDVNAYDEEGYTALHYACKNGHAEIVRILIEELHVNIHIIDKNGKTAFQVAQELGNDDIIAVFLFNGKKDKKERTVLHYFCAKGDIEAVKKYAEKCDINTQDSKGWTPLHVAVSFNHKDLVKLLTRDLKADKNIPTNEGWTPLHLAAIRKNYKSGKLLLDGNIDQKDKIGQTPLHLCSMYGDFEFAKALIEKGADLEAKDQSGKTPLHVSVLYHRFDPLSFVSKDGKVNLLVFEENTTLDATTITLLLKKGANVNACTLEGNTPLHIAVATKQFDLLHLLIKNGADIHAKNQKKYKPCSYQITRDFAISNCMFSISWQYRQNNNDHLSNEFKDAYEAGNWEKIQKLYLSLPDFEENSYDFFGMACEEGELPLVQWFVDDLGMEIDHPIEDIDDVFYPIHFACMGGHLDVVQFFLEKGVDINIRTEDDLRTPLHISAQYGYLELVQLFIERGALVDVQDDDGKTPLDLCCAFGHWKVIEYLINETKAAQYFDELNKAELFSSLCENLDLSSAKLLWEKYKDEISISIDISQLLNDCFFEVDEVDQEEAFINLAQWMCEEFGYDLLREKNKSGETLLHVACEYEHLLTMQFLLENGTNVNEINTQEETALHLACKKLNFPIVHLLIEFGADPQMMNNKKVSPMKVIFSYFPLDEVQWIVNKLGYDIQRDQFGFNPFFSAVTGGNIEVGKWLAEHNHLDVNQLFDELGNTPLHIACNTQCLNLAKWLVKEKNADRNKRNLAGETPLYFSSYSGCQEISRWLIEECHAEYNYHTKEGWSPFAVACYEGHLDSFQYFSCFYDLDLIPRIGHSYSLIEVTKAKNVNYWGLQLPKISLFHESADFETSGKNNEIIKLLKP